MFDNELTVLLGQPTVKPTSAQKNIRERSALEPVVQNEKENQQQPKRGRPKKRKFTSTQPETVVKELVEPPLKQQLTTSILRNQPFIRLERIVEKRKPVPIVHRPKSVDKNQGSFLKRFVLIGFLCVG